MDKALLLNALMENVQKGNLEKVIKLIEFSGEDNVNNFFYNGYSMLHIASENGWLNIVEMLVSKGHEVDWKDDNTSSTPIHLAVKNSHVDVVKFLMVNRANVNEKDNEGMTPFHHAVKNGDFEIADLLLSKGRSKIVAMILKSNININEQDNSGRTPLHLAVISGNAEIAELIISNKYGSIIGKNQCLLDITDIHGNTPLHYCVDYENIQVMHVLIENGANLNICNEEGDTPIFLATQKGTIEILEYLLSFENDINIRNSLGDTLLIKAAKSDKLKVVNYLIEHKISINATNHNDENALLASLESTNLIMANTLIDKGANFKQTSKNGYNVVTLSVKFGLIEIIKSAINIISVTEEINKESIFTACKYGQIESLKFILKNNDRFRYNKKFLKEACFVACEYDQLDVIKLFVSLKFDVISIDNKYGESLLHIAAQHGNYKIVEFLLITGAKASVKNDVGRTPLHSAAKNCLNTNTIDLLLNAGANPDDADKEGITPRMIANKKSELNIFQVSTRKVKQEKSEGLSEVISGSSIYVNNESKNLKGNLEKLNNNIPIIQTKSNANTVLKTKNSKPMIGNKILKILGGNLISQLHPELVLEIKNYNNSTNYRLVILLSYIKMIYINGGNLKLLNNIFAINGSEFKNISLKKIMTKLYIVEDRVDIKNIKFIEDKKFVYINNKINKENNYFVSFYDKHIVPYLGDCLIEAVNDEYIHANEFMKKYISDLNELKQKPKRSRIAKLNEYESRYNKLINSDAYLKAKKLKYASFRCNYLNVQISNKNIEQESTRYLEIENELNIINESYPSIMRIGYKKIIENYLTLKKKSDRLKFIIFYGKFLERGM